MDVFTQLTQCFEVLQKLECQNPEIWNRYMKRFAKTVVKVLMAYADMLTADFPNHLRDERMAGGSGRIVITFRQIFNRVARTFQMNSLSVSDIEWH